MTIQTIKQVVADIFGNDELRSKRFENQITRALRAQRDAGAREERERVVGVIKKIELLPYYAKLCQNINGLDYCGTCEQSWEDCSCSARNTGHKKGIETVLQRLSSLEINPKE